MPQHCSPNRGGGPPVSDDRMQFAARKRVRDEPERRSPVSSLDHPPVQEDVLVGQSIGRVATGPVDDERPPVCPRCQKRLVILATHAGSDPAGLPLRRQLWGCPRGHSTVYRIGGSFGGIELLPDVTT
jgi:hypothetical protein